MIKKIIIGYLARRGFIAVNAWHLFAMEQEYKNLRRVVVADVMSVFGNERVERF